MNGEKDSALLTRRKGEKRAGSSCRSSISSQHIRCFQHVMSQRMGTIYPGAPGATGRQARARSLAEHATSNTTEEANDRCRTPDDEEQ